MVSLPKYILFFFYPKQHISPQQQLPTVTPVAGSWIVWFHSLGQPHPSIYLHEIRIPSRRWGRKWRCQRPSTSPAASGPPIPERRRSRRLDSTRCEKKHGGFWARRSLKVDNLGDVSGWLGFFSEEVMRFSGEFLHQMPENFRFGNYKANLRWFEWCGTFISDLFPRDNIWKTQRELNMVHLKIAFYKGNVEAKLRWFISVPAI